MVAILGRLLNKNINFLQKEYNTLKAEETSLLKSLQINRKELFAFAEPANNDNTEEKNGSPLSILGEKTKKNLYAAITSHMKEEYRTTSHECQYDDTSRGCHSYRRNKERMDQL